MHDKAIFYLKINRQADYTLKCLQHWIDIASVMECNYYIICDNKRLLKTIQKRIKFNDRLKSILQSDRKTFLGIIDRISTPRWKNATFTNLTIFQHAKENNIKSFWNIDADDTLFAIEPDQCAKALLKVQKYADEHKIDTISLDMWYSRTKGRHWSWGVAYVRNDIDYFEIFNSVKNIQWTTKYLELDVNFNLDWFFTYLGSINKINIQTFYVENVYFIHWGSFLLNPTGSSISYWSNQKIIYPLYKGFINGLLLDELPIASDCIKFDVGINIDKSLNFILSKISNIRLYPRELIRGHQLTDVVDSFNAKYNEALLTPKFTSPTSTKPPFKEKHIKLLGMPIYDKYFNKITGLKEYKLFGFKHPFKKQISKFFDKLISQSPDDCDDIYLIRQSTGETYLIANMIDEITRNNGSNNPFYIFTRKYHFDLFEMYSGKFNAGFMPISPIDFPYFDKYKYTYKNKNIYILFNHKFLLENLLCEQAIQETDFDYTKEIARHTGVQNYKQLFKYPSIKSEYQVFAKNYLNKFNINDEDFVVLFNQSGTIAGPDNSFWRDLEKALNKKNIPYIYNNPKLNFKEILAICERSKAIIAARTGAIESLLPFKKKMFILYSNAYRFNYNAKQAIKVYTLLKYPFAIKDNIHEYNIETSDNTEIIEDIIFNLE